MSENMKLELGHNGKYGELDFSKIKSGLKEEELAGTDEGLKSIFAVLDINGDKKLDRKELTALYELIKNLSGDNNLSIQEARKFQNGNKKLSRENAKILMQFLDNMAKTVASQGVETVEIAQGYETITYDDGHIEQLFDDGSVIVTTSSEDKTVITHKDENGEVLEETVKENGIETKTEFNNGYKTRETRISDTGKEIINYDSEGNPQNKIVTDKEANITEEYDFVNGEAVLRKRTDKLNNSESFYDGARETTIYENDGIQTKTVSEDGFFLNKTVSSVNSNNQQEVVYTEYNGKNYTEEGSVDGVLRYQKKVIDNNEYQVNYDEDGNTLGIIVQNGESIAAIAKKFNCSVQDLIRVNAAKIHGKYPNAYFYAGEEIKIPRTMEADEPVLFDRKSKEEAVQEYTAFMQKREQERIQAEQEERISANAQSVQGAGSPAAESVSEVEQTQQMQQSQELQKEAKEIAEEIYSACDDMAAAVGKERFEKALKRVNKDNILEVINQYEQLHPKESILAVISNEKGSSNEDRMAALTYIIDTLYEKGLEAGADKYELNTLRNNFLSEMRYQYRKIGFVDNTKMESLLDTIRGVIIAAASDAEDITEKEAIEQVAEMAGDESQKANTEFDTAREDEGWIAKTADTVCGWFGCTTIEDMKAKLGEHADDIIRLTEAKTEAEFKAIFYEIFGVEFNKDKIAAYNKSVENYELAQLYSMMNEKLPEFLAKAENLSESELKDLIKTTFAYDDAEIEVLVFTNKIEGEDAKTTLIRYFKECADKYQKEYDSITNGKTLQDMENEINLIQRGIFGTKDIVSEVMKFNKNMQLTEAIATGVLEIGGTIALGLIPGTQGLAAVRIAAMAAKYGSKGVKIAKLATKGLKVLDSSIKAGVATGAVLATDGRNIEEIKQHVKMNMSFAAAGSVVSELAPIVAKSFNITNKLATELCEDTMDVFSSYCVSKGLGMDYGKTDAGVDLIVGMLMARLAHIKSDPNVAKPKADSATGTLDIASSQGTAHPADVQVGAQKAATIKAEVETALNNSDITGEELARIRQEVESLSDRDLRRKLLERIDNKAKTMDAANQQAFNSSKFETLQNNINHIFEKHSVLNATDVRVMKEYISYIEDINVLNELKDKLKQKEVTYGGVTDNYRALYKSIDDRINTLTPKPQISAEEAKSRVYSMLNSDKGMVKEEFEQLLGYIKSVQSIDELEELSALVSKKKMPISYKPQLRAAFDEQSNVLKQKMNSSEPVDASRPDETPETDEVPKSDEAPKTDETPEADEVIKSEETPEADNSGDGNSASAPKSYAEMTEDELLKAYQELKVSISAKGAKLSERFSAIKKIKEIQLLLDEKGFKIENDQLVSKKSGKDNVSSDNASLDAKVNLKDLKQRLGTKLFRSYKAAQKAISSMKTSVDFDKIRNYIVTKFRNFTDVSSALLNDLVQKAKEIGILVESKVNKFKANIMTNISNTKAKIETSRPTELDKYVKTKPKKTMRHSEFVTERTDLFGEDVKPMPGTIWQAFDPKDMRHGAWKMHVYSVDEADWQRLCDVIIPYLKEHDIEWKTLNSAFGPEYLIGDPQQGKAFTVYPRDNEHMAQVARDLDYIIRQSKLGMDNSHIIGDNQLGGTGRLFYRYEFNSKKYKDEVLDLSERKDYEKYGQRYDANRGEGRHLANDMVLSDDIWKDFDPSNPHSVPATSLQSGVNYSLTGITKINMGDYVLDLTSPDIQDLLNGMSNGDQLIIGREGDIVVPASFTTTSRQHAMIIRIGDEFYIRDIGSANGTSIS